jgi:hypothetical protein
MITLHSGYGPANQDNCWEWQRFRAYEIIKRLDKQKETKLISGSQRQGKKCGEQAAYSVMNYL